MQRLNRVMGVMMMLAIAAQPSPGAEREAAGGETHRHYHNMKHRVMQDGTRFTTSRGGGAPLPLPAEDDAFTFVVFGDRTGGQPEGVKVLERAVTEVNLLEPDLVMTVGDLVQGVNPTAQWLEQMREYKGIMSKLLMPWFPVAGNHDVYWRDKDAPRGGHEAEYEMHFGPLWYAMKHKDCWFIALYSDEGNPETGEQAFKADAQKMSDAQFNWLKQTLAKAKDAQHVFVFLHHPRWLGGERYGDDWEKVHKALADAGNVRIVFAGHIHRMRYDGARDGIEYVTLASVGANLHNYGVEAGYLHHFHLVTVRKQQIALAAVAVGDVIDVRSITGKVSEAAEKLASMKPDLSGGLTTQTGGGIVGTFRATVTNSVDEPIDVTLLAESEDTRWRFRPDHAHKTLRPGESLGVDFQAAWPGPPAGATGTRDESYRPVEFVVRMDYLSGGRRFSLTEKRLSVPLDGIVPAPGNAKGRAGKGKAKAEATR